MSVEQQVDALATSVDELTGAVITKKAALDASVVDAQSATAQAQDARTNTLSARDQAGAFKDAAYTAAQSAASAVAYQDLTALAESKDVTAADLFIYDTAKDSDGGAWRHRCAGTSWYREPLNTATRGSRREFPAVAVVVAQADKLNIYDGDDPSLPMWRVHDLTGFTVNAICASGGKILIATDGGLIAIDYLADSIDASVSYSTNSGPAIVNNACNDVAMTVLPDAPIDPATGLPVPTIVVATDGGVSVIKDDGTATNGAVGITSILFCDFADNQDLVYGWSSYACRNTLSEYEVNGFSFSVRDLRPGVIFNLPAPIASTIVAVSGSFEAIALNTGLGSIIRIGQDIRGSEASPDLMSTLVISTYTTGWMPGDVKGAFLSDTDATDIVGGTAPDRSVNATPLTVNGTITRSPVATGAELIAYSGFSVDNYLEGTHASYVDRLYALGWEQTNGVWGFKHGVVSAAPIDGLTITGNTLKIAGTKPKALIRLTATVPTAAQLAKIEADERVLFQENAACTLYGASDAVTALAHDPDTDLLHVGTSAGRSVFKGLCRVANTTVPVSAAIAAAGGMVVEE